MTGCFCGSGAALFFAETEIFQSLIVHGPQQGGGSVSLGGSLAIQFAAAQVAGYIAGIFNIEIVNLLKHDTPVLICFLVTYLTYFGIDGLNLLMPRLFNVASIEWGHWYFVPICIAIFSGLVVGSLIERQILVRILEHDPPKSSTYAGSPRLSEEMLAIGDGLDSSTLSIEDS